MVINISKYDFEKDLLRHGVWVAQLVNHQPSAQVVISQFWDRAPRRALLTVESVCPSLSALLPACDHSLS